MSNKLKTIFSLGFLKEAIGSIIPTALGYYGLEAKIGWKYATIIALLFAVLMFLIMIYAKLEEYAKSISKVLAIGYFKNFVEKIVYLLQSISDEEIVFIFKNETIAVNKKNIEVKLFMVKSQDELTAVRTKINEETKSAYIQIKATNRPFFVDACYDKENQKLYIYDCPRTLLSLKDYVSLTEGNDEKLNAETKGFYKFFNVEFNNWWCKLDKVGVNIALV